MENYRADFLRKRSITRARIRYLLEKGDGGISVEDIEVFIFEHEIDRGPACVRELSSTLNQIPSSIDEDGLFQLLQDAWNYFPHRALDGKAPAELVADLRQAVSAIK